MTASRRMGLLAGLLLGTSAALGAEGIAGQGQVAPAKGDLTRPVAREAATADQAPALAKSAATIGQTSIVKTGAARAAQPRTSPPPANDDCFNAYVFDLYPGSPVTFQDDNTGATTDCPALAPYGDAWYKFTTYETLEVVIKYCGTTPAFWNANIAFDPTCPCSGAWLFASAWDNSSCGDGNWSLYWHNLPAGTYYWPLLTDSAGGYAEGPYTLTFEATVPPPGPECPTEALFGQGPPGPTGNGIPFLSAITSSFNYKVYDNFYSVPDQIGDLHWWGFSLSYDENWYPCDPSELTFEIAFYVDNGGAPGTVVNTYLMTPTVVDTGLTYGTYPLYDFSVGSLLPCAVTHTGWLSIQSQSNPADCAFAWICTDAGDTLGWYEYDGSLFATHLSFAFCLLGGDCPPIYGACCDDYTGVCDDNVDWSDCLPPLRFTPGTLCAELSPSCGIVGACCDAGLNCVFTGLEADCDAIDGGFYPGQTCPEFACPDECQHRIDLYDCFGDGWNGNKLDVLVNGVTILSQITLPSGLGPLPFYFTAATGDTIQTIYYPIGGWPYEPYYMIYGGLGFLLGQDGGNCQQPTGITVIGNCTSFAIGACCVRCECRLESEQTCLELGGDWFAENETCPPLACISDYCWPGAQTCDEYISRVQIGAIDNSSGCEPDAQPPNYADYTNLCTDLVVAAGTPLIVTNGNPVWQADYCAVWIDWNRDCSIDSSEEVGVLAGVGPYTFTVTPPVGAQLGWARMRIAISYYYTPDPCGLQLYGEVEDYALNILEAPGACCWPDGSCSLTLPADCGGFWAGPSTACSGNDCQPNGVNDLCDIVSGYSTDCNANGIPDECEPFVDCNFNGIQDFCDIANGTSRDCNWNGILDECDIANGTSLDCQPNGIPDECDITPGCGWQIDDGMSESTWGLPDAGELCWMNHMFAPSWEVVGHIAACFGSPSSPGFAGVVAGQPFRVYVWSDPSQDGNPLDAAFLGEATGTVEADSIDTDVVQMVTISPPIAVNGSFFIGASVVKAAGGRPAPADDDGWTGPPDQSFLTFNSVPFDPSNITANLYPMSALGYPLTVFLLRGTEPFSSDCNHNGRPDECDVAPICQGPDCSFDCNANLIPDECELDYNDCNGNGRPDDCDIASGYSQDCNGNGIPDDCDIDPTDPDSNGQVSPDCNYNGIPDECDIASGFSQDCQLNGIPDECDVADGTSCDCQGDGIPDECQLWTWAGRNLLQWDDGSSENALGLPAGGELCWLTHFSGASMVTVIQTCFGTPMYAGTSGVSAGQPFRVYVWSDPNGDGDPTDAVFLGQASATVQAGSIDSDVFQLIPVNVNVADSFFVGVSVVTTWGYPAPMDEDGQQHDQAWIAFNTVPFDPTNLGPQLYNTTDIGYPCNWLLRAEVIPDYPCMPNDCNGNAVPDECDIGVQWDGYCTTPGIPCFPTECVSDWNHNGIPDTCELCGDLDYDGNVDLDDYWTFLDAFGTCAGDPKYNPWADMDGDGCITLLDYQAWRVCYKMANGKDFVAPKPKPMPKPAKKAS